MPVAVKKVTLKARGMVSIQLGDGAFHRFLRKLVTDWHKDCTNPPSVFSPSTEKCCGHRACNIPTELKIGSRVNSWNSLACWLHDTFVSLSQLYLVVSHFPWVSHPNGCLTCEVWVPSWLSRQLYEWPGGHNPKTLRVSHLNGCMSFYMLHILTIPWLPW